jgi:myo-inositol-1(or 4)-monophosphatase
MNDLNRIMELVRALSTEVAGFIRRESQSFDRSKIEQKSAWNNLVSYVDKESERLLVAGLEKIIPGSGFLAEEGTSIKTTNGFTWIIDPLDGTTNFTHAFPPFAVSIGLEFNGEMVLGVVHEVFANECFHSYQGSPAFCNDKQISVAATQSLDQSLLATGFPYNTGDLMDIHLATIRDLLLKTHGIRRLGSAATDLAYVACGRLDGFFEYNLSPWDVAAGSFLVRQAGGQVSDFSEGTNYLYGGRICAANAVHKELVEVIRKRWING